MTLVTQHLSGFGEGEAEAEAEVEAEADEDEDEDGDGEPSCKRRKKDDTQTLAKAALLLARSEPGDTSRAVKMLCDGGGGEAAFTASLLRADCLARAGEAASAMAAYRAYWQAAGEADGDGDGDDGDGDGDEDD